MRFQDMPYARPDLEAVAAACSRLTAQLEGAEAFAQADQAFLAMDRLRRSFDTQNQLARARQQMNTADQFYDGETAFLDQAEPRLEECLQPWRSALLASPWRSRFAAKYGPLFLHNMELRRKCFQPSVLPLLQEENALQTAYGKLMASARIPFQGQLYTLSQLAFYETHPDQRLRRAAWQAEGEWCLAQAPELDRIYDRLTRLRQDIARGLGFDSFVEVGYCRMLRVGYGRREVEGFRRGVKEHLVPLATRLLQAQAQRIGRPFPLSLADAALVFAAGNPRPLGRPEEILRQGQRLYRELSPHTAEFYDYMLENGLFDVVSRPNKAGGGFCTGFADYASPFIFANFNGTAGDIDVVTHEAGHAFAYWQSRQAVPIDYLWCGSETAEIHSMSMEFLTWPWAELFFGPAADQYRYYHLAAALTFIPYGCMVDEFQHINYDHPDLSPQQRNQVWLDLAREYQPGLDLSGLPFFDQGRRWQRQLHIYELPFYYIDYCLAQLVALEFWADMQKDPARAWEDYLALVRAGGAADLAQALAAGRRGSPFDPAQVRTVAQAAAAWLEQQAGAL